VILWAHSPPDLLAEWMMPLSLFSISCKR